MHTSKVLELIKSLDAAEIRWLAKFVRSPFYNQNKDVIALFDYIRKYRPAFSSPRLKKEVVFQAILPMEKFSDHRLRLIMHRLANLVEKFLVAQLFEKDKTAYKTQLIKALGERGLYDTFAKRSLELSRSLEDQPFRDEAYHEQQWQLKRDLWFHPETPRYSNTASLLEEALKHLDIAYYMNKFRFSGELLNRQNILSERYDFLLLEDLQNLLPESSYLNGQIVLQVYNDILLLMANPLEEKIYNRLEHNFKANLHLFRKPDQATLLRYLINCTIQLNNTGKTKYLNHQFELYQLGLAEDLFTENGVLSEFTFLNIVITGTVLGEINWVENFLAKVVDIPSHALDLAWAYWHFANKSFASANELLLKIDQNDLAYALRIKSLSIRNHYEMFLQDESYYDLFLNECKSFEKFIRRNGQITANRASGYLNFIGLIKKLGNLRFKNVLVESKKVEKLREELNQSKTIVAKQWLRKKLKL